MTRYWYGSDKVVTSYPYGSDKVVTVSKYQVVTYKVVTRWLPQGCDNLVTRW